MATWVRFAMLVLPRVPDPRPKAYRHDRAIQVPWKWPSAKQEHFPMGSRSPQRCSIAGVHSLHKEGLCATYHRAQKVTGHTKGSCQTRLPPQITPQWWLWKTCIAKREPARTRPARGLCQGWCCQEAVTHLWSGTLSPLPPLMPFGAM